ncbi:helix-turn-helix transcriptional regulator [Halorussus sp. AFM4]|uniref:helix-turn-helix transcriptional regulator n=1 Tax=Halorussus sp. AFM4 TaxID=3421651 RepID=UPI003EC0B488
MSDDDRVVEFVTGSAARTEVLAAVTGGTGSTAAILDRVPASESAVYGALAELEDCELIRKVRSDRWEPTGTGRIVSEVIDEQRRTESVLRTDSEYWRTHDATALPRLFRTSLSALADADVVRATDTDPNRVVREVRSRIESADTIDIVAPIYHDEYVAALRSGGDTSARLVLGTAVIDQLADAEDGYEEMPETVDVRVRPVSFALTVTDDCALLSLPRLDGSYDSRTEVIAESDEAREWSRWLFERYWTTGIDPADHLDSPPSE